MERSLFVLYWPRITAFVIVSGDMWGGVRVVWVVLGTAYGLNGRGVVESSLRVAEWSRQAATKSEGSEETFKMAADNEWSGVLEDSSTSLRSAQNDTKR